MKWLTEPSEQFIFMGVLSELLEEKHFRSLRDHFRESLVSMMPALRKLIVKLYEGSQHQTGSGVGKHWELAIESKLVLCLRVGCRVSRLYESCF